MNYIKSLTKGMHRGQGGFTLIELLIVIAILGIVSAVVALNIGGFFGQGKEQAANTEAHQVQTAEKAYMAQENLSTFAGTITSSSQEGPEDYLLNPGLLQATYTIADGAITAATATSGGKWDSCTFDSNTGAWSCP